MHFSQAGSLSSLSILGPPSCLQDLLSLKAPGTPGGHEMCLPGSGGVIFCMPLVQGETLCGIIHAPHKSHGTQGRACSLGLHEEKNNIWGFTSGKPV